MLAASMENNYFKKENFLNGGLRAINFNYLV